MEKSDLLFLIVGSNPMPNIIAAATRIKKSGKIVLIHTEETKKIAKTLEVIINSKEGTNKIEKFIEIRHNDVDDIKKIYDEQISSLFCRYSDKIIELNFTGGTKIMSSIAFNSFRNAFKKENVFKGILSYVDSEKRTMNFEIFSKKNKSEYINLNFEELEQSFLIDSKDVAQLHDIDGKYREGTGEEYIFPEFYEDMFGLFNTRDFQKYQHLLQGYNHIFKAFNNIKNFGELKDKCDELIKQGLWLLDEKKDIDFYFKNIDKSNNNIKQFIKQFKGFWLEGYIFNLLNDLKKRNIIEQFYNSLEKATGKTHYEVDFIIYNKFKTYEISVTIGEELALVENKAYEILYRATQLSGEDASICSISLYRDSKEIENIFRNPWEDKVNNRRLVVCWDRFTMLEEILIAWIQGGDYNEHL